VPRSEDLSIGRSQERCISSGFRQVYCGFSDSALFLRYPIDRLIRLPLLLMIIRMIFCPYSPAVLCGDDEYLRLH